jgi:hypothetical protein
MQNKRITFLFISLLLIAAPIVRADTIQIINYPSHLRVKSAVKDRNQHESSHRSIEKINQLLDNLKEVV